VAGDPSPIVFVDANVLAKPVTRTLLMRCAPSDWTVAWSQTVEHQASPHLPPQATPLARVRELAGLDLSPTGCDAERFVGTSPTDRQVLADAEAAHATFLVTEDVDDFDEADLRAIGLSAVNPDLFWASQSNRDVYARTLTVMAAAMTNPSRTTSELHAALARQHPRLFRAHRDAFDVGPRLSGHSEPAVLYRGTTCLGCLKVFTPDKLDSVGRCPECARQR